MPALFFAKLAIFVFLVVGCYRQSSNKPQEDAGKISKETGADSDTDTDTDTDSDADSDSDSGTENCQEQDIALAVTGVKVMFLVDFSGSMLQENKWATAKEAIFKMVTDSTNKDLQFGLHNFPTDSKCDIFGGMNCAVSTTPAVALGHDKGVEINTWMDSHIPCFQNATPLVAGVRNYIGVSNGGLRDANTTNYLIVLAAGEDSCFHSAGPPYTYNAQNMLAGLADDLKETSNIGVIPIGFGEIQTIARLHLNSLARNGGTSFKEFIPVEDALALEIAMTKIANAIRPCKYQLLLDETDSGTSKINMYFDGVGVNRNDSHDSGWDWTASQNLEIEFFGEHCQQLKEGKVKEITATSGCRTRINDKICTAKEISLEFPPAALMFLLDVSYSIGMVPSGANGQDRWYLATTGITHMLVDDRNKHLLFGLYPFPNLPESVDKCIPGSFPEVSLGGAESRLAIIEWMTTNNPYVMEHFPSMPEFTPLIATMERLFDNPAGIDRSDGSGMVVVISDGIDTCEEGEANLAKIEQVTKELVSTHNIRVYAIGYDTGYNNDGRGGDEATLNAIAQNGGTGINTYQKVTSETEMKEILEKISSMVTSCVFDVPNAGADKDYNVVNFLVDGEVVPLDLEENAGWNWTDNNTKSKVAFFGTYCEMLKAGQVEDVVIQFGCKTEI